MAPNKNMLEDNFIEEDEDDFSLGEDLEITSHKDETVKDTKSDPVRDGEEKIEIEVVDDTPREDKGKRVADPDKDGPPEVVGEAELRNYSKDVQKRISKMTERQHAERRRADELSRQLTELQSFTKGLLQSNNKMADVIDKGEETLVGEHKVRLQAQLDSAKKSYKEAHEAGDPDGMAAAQEIIAKTAAAIDRVSTFKAGPMPRQNEEEFDKRFPQPKPVPQIDQATQKWLDDNPWFETDQVMNGFAMAVHNHLTNNLKIPATDPRYFKTIDNEVRKRFPEKFSNDRPRRTQSIVAPATREGGGRTQKVILTESQMRLAKKFGLTPQQYAAEVLKQQRGG